MAFGKFIRNRDHILGRNLFERFLQRLFKDGIIGSRLWRNNVTLPLR